MKKWTLLLCFLAITACASDDDNKDKDKPADKPKQAKINTDVLICPQVAILQPAQQVMDYGGEKPDPSQLVAQARMISIEGDCAYQDDGIDITFTLHMTAARGKRLGDQASFPYFVAILDPAEKILSRQSMTASFAFDGDKLARVDDPLHVFIPLTKAAQQAGPDYRVLVGFKLPHNQAAK